MTTGVCVLSYSLPDLLKNLNRFTIRIGQHFGRVTEPGSPVCVGTPGRALENQSSAEILRDLRIRPKVLAQRCFTRWRLQ